MDWSCAPFVRKGFISKQITSTKDDQSAIWSYFDTPFTNELHSTITMFLSQEK